MSAISCLVQSWRTEAEMPCSERLCSSSYNVFRSRTSFGNRLVEEVADVLETINTAGGGVYRSIATGRADENVRIDKNAEGRC